MEQLKCPDCKHKWFPSKSKRVIVCPNCESIEKTGKSLVEVQKEKKLATFKKMADKAQSRLGLSEKGAERARDVAAIIKVAKKQVQDGGFYRCEGCHQYFKQIDGSHKIPKSQSMSLAADPENITPLCRNCHNAWENGTVEQMIALKCFVRDMKYLYQNDRSRFQKIFFRLLDAYAEAETPELETTISKLEKFDNE